MFTSSQSGACKIQGVPRALGVNRHNIKKAMERCLQLDTKKNVFWIGKQQQKRSDALPQALQELVYNGG
jgi:hypothetical protein